jgi:hypothetical protein
MSRVFDRAQEPGTLRHPLVEEGAWVVSSPCGGYSRPFPLKDESSDKTLSLGIRGKYVTGIFLLTRIGLASRMRVARFIPSDDQFIGVILPCRRPVELPAR